MQIHLRSNLLRLALAGGLVATAAGLSLYLQSVVSAAGYIFFYVTVVACSWFGGAWCGGFAVVLSMLAVEYFFIPPVHSFAVHAESWPVFLEFTASAGVVAWFSSWRKQAEAELQRARDELQMRVEERTAELRQKNEQLLAEMAERRRAEEAYHEAQTELARVTRMSALGALAASISHEVNQPLAAVVTNADACSMWLSLEPPNLDEARLAVDSIAREGTRASEVVRRIRALFTKATRERASVGINDLILEVQDLMQGEIAKNQIVLRIDLASDLPGVLADKVQLQQVMVNLVLNAIEAMHDVTDRQKQLVIRSELRSANEVLVAVRDSGVGIPPKDEKRVFDAFYTTKARGMGMGLSISHSIVEAHGGRLWAASNDDHGATVQFLLPANEESGNE